MAGKTGRPLAFDRDAALRIALDVFWRQGYAGTSLEDLTAAMGIGRSSFYASFQSKHAVLLDVLNIYTSALLARMASAIQAESDPRRALMAMLQIVACTDEPAHGCLFVNAVTELLPADEQVAELARRYLRQVDQQATALLQQLGFSPADARSRSGALLALATGALTLRRAGEPSRRIQAMLGHMSCLMA